MCFFLTFPSVFLINNTFQAHMAQANRLHEALNASPNNDTRRFFQLYFVVSMYLLEEARVKYTNIG